MSLNFDWTTHTVTGMDAESAGIPAWFDRMTGQAFANTLGLVGFNGTTAEEMAKALTEANRNGAHWARHTIRKALPQADENMLMKAIHGIRLW